MRFRRFCRTLADVSPVQVPPPAGLVDATRTLDEDLHPQTIATAISMLAVLVAGLLAGALVLGTGESAARGVLAVFGVTCVIAGGLYAVPILLATRRRAAWSGALPGFVCRVALGMRLTQALEQGIRAGFSTTGPLTQRVPRRQGVDADTVLAAAVADLGPTARRARGLLTAAATAADPDPLLDRAVETAMDGIREQMRTHAASLQGPVTAIYAFGVVLPLALVGILPAAPIAGYRLPLLGLAFVLDVFLPCCIVAASIWLVARRPLVHPPPRLPRTHDALGTRTRVTASGTIGVVVGVLLSPVLPSWATWSTPLAWGVGAALLARYQPALPAIESVRTTRAAVPDLLALLGDGVADGLPPERALSRATDTPGTVGAIATEAASIRERLGLPVSRALAGRHGPLGRLHARQADELAALVESAATAGRVGGRALSRYADHLDALAELEHAARADLARITGTLGLTAEFYAPLIGGVTVALATRVPETSSALATTDDGFATVVAGYVLVVAVVLPTLASALQHGRCRVRIGVRVGRAALLAGGLLPLSAHLTSRLL